MSSLPPTNIGPNSLPFPLDYAADGTITTQWIAGVDKSALNATLAALCVRFGLKPASKNKEGYLTVLQGYSQNRNQWRPVGESAKVNTRHHKAVWPVIRAGASKKRLSKKRQEALLLCTDASGALLPASPVLRIPSKIAGERLSTWATSFLATKSTAVLPTPSTCAVTKMATKISNPVLCGQVLGLNVIPDHQEETPIHPGELMSQSLLGRPVTSLSQNRSAAVSSGCLLKGTNPISLLLAGGMVVFQPMEIPVPPNISLDIEGLKGMWDDQSPLWKNDCPLKIRGISIPIKLWQQIYGVGRCTEVWTGSLKQKWHKWKYLASAYSSEHQTDQFLEKWPGNGRVANITGMNNYLREVRKARVNMIVAEARAECGQGFEDQFRYQKNRQSVICSKPEAIARRYLRRMDSSPY